VENRGEGEICGVTDGVMLRVGGETRVGAGAGVVTAGVLGRE
jgi:hypothetical protein